MEITTMTRPSAPLTAACAPSVTTPILAAARAPISQAHQVQAQAELALANGRTSGIKGSTGFMGLSGSVDSKRYVDERGVPPRGRPV